MDVLTYVIPVLAVVIGWFLNEWSRVSHDRREGRRARFLAIANMLELRHQTLVFQISHREIESRLDISAEEHLRQLHWIDSLMPSIDELSQRYNHAVELVIISNPTLGYQLRSQEIMPLFLRMLRKLISADIDEATSELWYRLEKVYIDLIKPDFDSLLIELSASCGWRMRRRVMRLMAKQERVEISPSQEEAIRRLKQIEREAASLTGNP